MSEIHQRANRAAGRSKGSKKDFNRRKIRNPNGRIIDYDGRQCKKLLLNGYKENDEKTQLIADDNFEARKVKNHAGSKQPILIYEKVRIRDTSRMIIISASTFKKISKNVLL